MTINDVLFFDSETTGTPPRGAEWSTDYEDFPHIVQLAWMIGNKVESHIIRPDGWVIPEEAVAIHGITTERALAEGEPFEYVVDLFVAACLDAGLVCAHNIYFDTSVIKANILRSLGRSYYDVNDVECALHKSKRIDTMRPTMKWVDARMANGRLKFPKLEELYSRCFPGETFPAHDALEDVKALARCLPVVVENGLIELAVKTYDEAPKQEEQPNNPVSAFAKIADAASDAAKIAADAANEFGGGPKCGGCGSNPPMKEENDKPVNGEVNAPEIAVSPKISDVAADLLAQTDF